jgi:predicted RNA-binding Zn ribbon-like protein
MEKIEKVPAWYPFDPDEIKPAPMPLLRVQAFLNTRYFEDGRDLLSDQEDARVWLTSAGVLPEGAALAAAELQSARAVRDAMRSLLEGEGQLAALRELADAHDARLRVQKDGALTLEPSRRAELGDGLFELLLIIRGAQEDGTWKRMRACANPDCRWAFYDRSRNQQGHWCDMAVCGNRLKNRRLRARQASSTAT